MSTYVLMKILESAPSRYDQGIRILTLGKLDKAYDHLALQIHKGQRVLDIGCGTGALTLRAARAGASVKGIDVNASMLEIARRRVRDACLSGNVELCEMGVAELGDENPESYDVVMSGLCFSELTEDELKFTLQQVQRLLKPGGLLLIADEVKPRSLILRILNRAIRFPLVLLTFIMTQTTTKAVNDLPNRVLEAGFTITTIRLNKFQSFIVLVGSKPQ